MIKVKDLQFPNFFITNEININPLCARQILNVEIEITNIGEPDSVVFKNNKLYIVQPSSLSRFLFNVLYHTMSIYIPKLIQKDKLSLGLLFMCKNYTYANYNIKTKRGIPPVIIKNFYKLPILNVLIKDLVEPLVGKIKNLPLMFIKSNFIDACEKIESSEKFTKYFNIPTKTISFNNYPFLVVNSSLNNESAQYAHIFYKVLINSIGDKKTEKLIRNILLSKSGNIAQNLIEILKILDGNPIFILDFLKFIKSNVTLNNKERIQVIKVLEQCIKADNYLNNCVKTADYKYTPSVFKQWHQWSMLVGLIEKQLAPMRGSMWPASDNIKPIEDKHRQMETEQTRKKGKSQLNFEELLELARQWYNHKAIQPGKLAEYLLKEHRVWKT